jgi:transcriptional regulator with XRE-family HTH domain
MSDPMLPGPGERFAIGVAHQRTYTKENFAKNLRTLLGVHGLTARETARLTGVSVNALSSWMTGERDPSLASMQKLAGFFEIDAFKLLGQYTGSFLHEELADLERWERVEQKLRGSSPAGEAQEVTPMKKRRKK